VRAEQALVADDNDVVDILAVDECIAQLRANTGRFAGCDYERSVEDQT